jgi:hypothetical protein
MNLINRNGQIFNRLTIIERVVINKLPFYTCKCICGTEVNIRTHRVISGHTSSCGCSRRESYEARGLNPVLTPGLAAARKVISYYKRNARRRGIEFSLTEADCLSLFSQNCKYCGTSPENVIRPAKYVGSFTYNGIDRTNNDVHYTVDNCVPCCKYCNFMKNNMTVEEFKAHITKIHKHLNPYII